jgi:hypothetical protein
MKTLVHYPINSNFIIKDLEILVYEYTYKIIIPPTFRDIKYFMQYLTDEDGNFWKTRAFVDFLMTLIEFTIKDIYILEKYGILCNRVTVLPLDILEEIPEYIDSITFDQGYFV